MGQVTDGRTCFKLEAETESSEEMCFNSKDDLRRPALPSHRDQVEVWSAQMT